MSALIEPIINKDTNRPITNVEMVRLLAKQFKKLENSDKQEDNITLSKMINGDNQIKEWVYQIAEEPNDIIAQSILERTLL